MTTCFISDLPIIKPFFRCNIIYNIYNYIRISVYVPIIVDKIRIVSHYIPIVVSKYPCLLCKSPRKSQIFFPRSNERLRYLSTWPPAPHHLSRWLATSTQHRGQVSLKVGVTAWGSTILEFHVIFGGCYSMNADECSIFSVYSGWFPVIWKC
jgi:hypothetical protein